MDKRCNRCMHTHDCSLFQQEMKDAYKKVSNKLTNLIMDINDIEYVVDGEDEKTNRKKNNLKNVLLRNLDAAYAIAEYLYNMEVDGEDI